MECLIVLNSFDMPKYICCSIFGFNLLKKKQKQNKVILISSFSEICTVLIYDNYLPFLLTKLRIQFQIYQVQLVSEKRKAIAVSSPSIGGITKSSNFVYLFVGLHRTNGKMNWQHWLNIC